MPTAGSATVLECRVTNEPVPSDARLVGPVDLDRDGVNDVELWTAPPSATGTRLYAVVEDFVLSETTVGDAIFGPDVITFALAVGHVLERRSPERYVTVMTKSVRPGKVFVDWSQNSRHKTTIAPYSLRAREAPTVSTPVSWDEIEEAARGVNPLVFDAEDVMARVRDAGDLFEPVLTTVQTLPG